MQEQFFASPPDWHLKCVVDPRAWYNGVMVQIHVALAPAAARAN